MTVQVRTIAPETVAELLHKHLWAEERVEGVGRDSTVRYVVLGIEGATQRIVNALQSQPRAGEDAVDIDALRGQINTLASVVKLRDATIDRLQRDLAAAKQDGEALVNALALKITNGFPDFVQADSAESFVVNEREVLVWLRSQIREALQR